MQRGIRAVDCGTCCSVPKETASRGRGRKCDGIIVYVEVYLFRGTNRHGTANAEMFASWSWCNVDLMKPHLPVNSFLDAHTTCTPNHTCHQHTFTLCDSGHTNEYVVIPRSHVCVHTQILDRSVTFCDEMWHVPSAYIVCRHWSSGCYLRLHLEGTQKNTSSSSSYTQCFIVPAFSTCVCCG